MSVTLLTCPHCPRRVTAKELRDYEGMCEHCWTALEQMQRWSNETVERMIEKARDNLNGGQTMPNTQIELPGLKMPELEKPETRVVKGLGAFVDVGRALMEIQEKRGYLLRGCKTMEDYCEKQFHFSLRHGQRLMIAAETAQKVEKVIGEAPRNEAAARELNPIASNPKLIEKVKAELAKKKLTVATATAEKLQEVVDKIKPQTKSMFDEDPKVAKERESAKAVAAAGLSDQCPNCGKVPTIYRRWDSGWKCGDCNAVVRVSALPMEIETCKDCHAPLLDDSGICRKCGVVQ